MDIFTEAKITTEFKPYKAGYILEDGSFAIVDSYHGDSSDDIGQKGYPEFSETHPEDDTCIRLFKKEPNSIQYKKIELIIDEYLDRELYCKVEIFPTDHDVPYWKRPENTFYKTFCVIEGIVDADNIEVGNWTGYKIVKIIKQHYRHLNEEINTNGIEYYTEPETQTTHAIVNYRGQRTRLRSAVLIIKDNKVLVSREKGEDILAIPGGGLERNETPIDAGIRECQEEVHINIKNCRQTKHDYCTDENVIADWVKEHVPEDKQWVNYYTFLLIADYGSEFEGKVEKIDQDKSMLNNMRWVDIEEAVKLPTFREEWTAALKDAGYLNKEELNEVYPHKGESKQDFIARFMHATKDEYPDQKQRLAVAFSYWDNRRGHMNESLITEASRTEIISKSKGGDSYTDGGSRWDERTKIGIANTTRDYNKIDMNKFWKDDVLNFGVKVRGETDNYLVTIELSNIHKYIQDQVKRNDNELDRDVVTKALQQIMNSGDVKFDCTCPDFIYRLKYYATKNGYNAGDAENRASDVTNPNDTKGAACKHVLAVINNISWIRNIASVIVNYANYCKEKLNASYLKFIFPKIYGIDARRAEQMADDERLASDEKTINLVNALGKERGRFKKKEEPEEQKESLGESFTNKNDLQRHFDKHCMASPNFNPKGPDRNPFKLSEVHNKEEYKELAEWFASQPALSSPRPKNGIVFTGDILVKTAEGEFANGKKMENIFKWCRIAEKTNMHGTAYQLNLIVVYFFDTITKELKIRTFYKCDDRSLNSSIARLSGLKMSDYQRV